MISHLNTLLWLFTFLLIRALSFNSKKSKKKGNVLILNWQTKHISFVTSMINIFNFKCANPENSAFYYYFANRPSWNNSPDCPYNKKLSCLCLIWKEKKELSFLYCDKFNAECLNFISSLFQLKYGMTWKRNV